MDPLSSTNASEDILPSCNTDVASTPSTSASSSALSESSPSFIVETAQPESSQNNKESVAAPPPPPPSATSSPIPPDRHQRRRPYVRGDPITSDPGNCDDDTFFYAGPVGASKPYSEAEMQAFAESPKGQVLRKMEMLPQMGFEGDGEGDPSGVDDDVSEGTGSKRERAGKEETG